MKLFYRPNVLGRYFGLMQSYEHISGNLGYFTNSFGLWWLEIEFDKRHYKRW